MKMWTVITMMAAAALIAAGSAAAQGPQGKQGHQGKGLKQLLQEADANKDGKATFEEVKAVRPGMTQERFNLLDRNHDGVLSNEDRPANGPGKQGRMRGNGAGNGACGQGLGQGNQQIRGKGACGQGQGQGIQAQRQQRRQEWRNKMQQADADKDGKVTYAEIKTVCPNMTEERFKNRDRNGDGVLSPEDRKPKN